MIPQKKRQMWPHLKSDWISSLLLMRPVPFWVSPISHWHHTVGDLRLPKYYSWGLTLSRVLSGGIHTSLKWSNMKAVFERGSKKRESSPVEFIRPASLTMTWTKLLYSIVTKATNYTHLMLTTRKIDSNELFQIVFLQRRQDTSLKRFVICNNVSYV